MPNRICPDGKTIAGPGPCERNASGQCGWKIVQCPTTEGHDDATPTDEPTTEAAAPPVTNFDECAAAGNPIMKSYPEQCRDPITGTTFTRVIVTEPTDEQTTEAAAPPVTNFDECAAAGNPIMESYPEQCRDPITGTTFTKGEQNETRSEAQRKYRVRGVGAYASVGAVCFLIVVAVAVSFRRGSGAKMSGVSSHYQSQPEPMEFQNPLAVRDADC
jgi:hypothetical protein